MAITQREWSTVENPIKMDNLYPYPYFRKPSNVETMFSYMVSLLLLSWPAKTSYPDLSRLGQNLQWARGKSAPSSEENCEKPLNSMATSGLVKSCGLFLWNPGVHHWFYPKCISFGTDLSPGIWLLNHHLGFISATNWNWRTRTPKGPVSETMWVSENGPIPNSNGLARGCLPPIADPNGNSSSNS